MDPRAALQRNRNSGQSNMQAHLALDTFTNQENARKEQASAQEAAYYEKLNASAEKMLGPDRQRFDDMVSKVQSGIREKIAMYGGNRAEFLKNGGHKVLQNFSSDVTNSPEYSTYISNKENAVKIQDVMERGMGHLLSMRDKKSLENYEANGSGTISYSGIMAEIDYPSEQNYDLGQDVPLTDILGHEDNYMKILGNYTLNMPNDTNPTTQDLLGFMKAFGYGKKGSNRESARLRAKAATDAKKASMKEVKIKKDTRSQLFTTTLQKISADYVPQGTTVDSLFEMESGSYQPKNFLRNSSKTDTFLSSAFESSEWKNSSYAINEDEQGFDAHSIGVGTWVDEAFETNFGERWKPAEANEIASGDKDTYAEWGLGQKANDRGLYELDPADINDMYSTKGVELVGRNNLEAGEYKGEYKNLGIITGMIGKTADGNNQMIMQITDQDGETLPDYQRDHVEGLDKTGIKMGYFIALRNEDNDRIYYKRLNMEDTNAVRGLSEKIGAADDLKKQNESSQRLDEQFNKAEAGVNKEVENFDRKLLTIDKEVENNSNFLQESNIYASSEDPLQNRSTLMKSFYAMTGANMNNMAFNQMMENAPETAKLVRTHGHGTSDEELIDIYISEINDDDTMSDDQKAVNLQRGKTWKDTYKRYLQINKE